MLPSSSSLTPLQSRPSREFCDPRVAPSSRTSTITRVRTTRSARGSRARLQFSLRRSCRTSPSSGRSCTSPFLHFSFFFLSLFYFCSAPTAGCTMIRNWRRLEDELDVQGTVVFERPIMGPQDIDEPMVPPPSWPRMLAEAVEINTAGGFCTPYLRRCQRDHDFSYHRRHHGHSRRSHRSGRGRQTCRHPEAPASYCTFGLAFARIWHNICSLPSSSPPSWSWQLGSAQFDPPTQSRPLPSAAITGCDSLCAEFKLAQKVKGGMTLLYPDTHFHRIIVSRILASSATYPHEVIRTRL